MSPPRTSLRSGRSRREAEQRPRADACGGPGGCGLPHRPSDTLAHDGVAPTDTRTGDPAGARVRGSPRRRLAHLLEHLAQFPDLFAVERPVPVALRLNRTGVMRPRL